MNSIVPLEDGWEKIKNEGIKALIAQLYGQSKRGRSKSDTNHRFLQRQCTRDTQLRL